ncbi:MAG: hypothetical protein ACKVP5_09160 [Aestuariivirga sp.]
MAITSEREHELTSKANMVVATGVVVFIMLVKDWGFGLWWLLIVPILWFASSILVAMPFGLLKTAVAKKSLALGGLVDWLNYIVLIPLTYYALRSLNQYVYGW